MRIKVESLSPKGISVENGSADKLTFLDVNEVRRTNVLDGIEDKNNIISLSDICISEIEIDTRKDIDFYVNVDKPVIEMVFFISSNSTLKVDGIIEPILMFENQHNIFFYHKTGYQSLWKSGENQKIFTITIYPDNITKYLCNKSFKIFLNSIELQKNAVLFNQNLTITPKMYSLLKDIVDNKHAQGLRRLHIENCVYELLFLQIEQYNNLVKNTESKISTGIQNKITEAKELIDLNLKSPLSISDIALSIGINDYHLKKGFKELYNNTIYNYTISKRMEYAKRLLKDREMNVNEVAYVLGYNDSTNFTAAFKKYFGYTPGKLTRNT